MSTQADPSPLDRALRLCGGAAKMAQTLGLNSTQVVANWKQAGRQVPIEMCPRIERLTKGAVRCEDLRPDFDWAYLRGTKRKPVAQDTVKA